ncbi:MAG: protein-L-isoaspartate(D-aspartate) O-methyltransferase [Pseudomonadota bacterium]|nr:protein-L-isoaspartate(D-aspartate) O-methyltransferase [Pseudomonadota bacterium]
MKDQIDKNLGIGMTSDRTRSRLIDRLREQGIKSEDVLEKIRSVPRHLFVDEALASRAYEDTALPIGLGQTISQPYIVARMTEALISLTQGGRILEIGTGCGYQTAILSGFFKEIYTVERINSLLVKTKQRLRSMGIYNIHFRHGDGWEGWGKYGPYDAIIVAAAATEVPQHLLEQLSIGGTLIMPLGPAGNQELVNIRRNNDHYESKKLGSVSFVPLVKGK